MGRWQICLIDWCHQKPEWIVPRYSFPALQHQLPLLHVSIVLLQTTPALSWLCPHYASNGSIQKLKIILINLVALPTLVGHYIRLVLPLK